jgi:hypothetical protein
VSGIPDPVVTDFVSSAWKDVLQESSNELDGRQGHNSPLPLAGFLITESDLPVVDSDQSTVGESDPVEIATEVLQDPLGSLPGWATVNPPPLPPD